MGRWRTPATTGKARITDGAPHALSCTPRRCHASKTRMRARTRPGLGWAAGHTINRTRKFESVWLHHNHCSPVYFARHPVPDHQRQQPPPSRPEDTYTDGRSEGAGSSSPTCVAELTRISRECEPNRRDSSKRASGSPEPSSSTRVPVPDNSHIKSPIMQCPNSTAIDSRKRLQSAVVRYTLRTSARADSHTQANSPLRSVLPCSHRHPSQNRVYANGEGGMRLRSTGSLWPAQP